MNDPLARVHEQLTDLITSTTGRRVCRVPSAPHDLKRYCGKCEARLCGPDGGGKRPGDRCNRDAALSVDGQRWLCWTHEKARQNPYRKVPLEYTS